MMGPLSRAARRICLVALLSLSSIQLVAAQSKDFNIPAQPANTGIPEFAKQAGIQILVAERLVAGKRIAGLSGSHSIPEALTILLQGTGLVATSKDGVTYTLMPPTSPSASPNPTSGDAVALRPISAQSTPETSVGSPRPTATADDSASGATGLEEIIVTSERREEGVDKVPISIAAYSQRTLDDFHIQSFADLATITPGLVISNATPGLQETVDVAIRGIYSGGNAPTTQFYVDETPVAIRTLTGAGPSGSPHPLIFDLDRVEVLRGPQGTLFGSSAMGGAIRYITPQPSVSDTSGYSKVEGSYTDQGGFNYQVGVAYGSPIVDHTLGFRVSAWVQQDAGWIDHEDPFTGELIRRDANSSNAYVIRPAITFAPSEALSITPSLFMQRTHSDWPDTYWVNSLPQPERGTPVSGEDIGEPYTDEMRVSSLAIKYLFSGLALTSDSSYLNRHSTSFDDATRVYEEIFGGSPLIPSLANTFSAVIHQETLTSALQQEFRLASAEPSSRLNWVAGLYYRHSAQNLTQYSPGSMDPLTEAAAGLTSLQFFGNPNYVLNGVVLNGYNNFDAVDISEAAFVNVDFGITERLKVNLGVRYEHSIVEHQSEISAGPVNGLTYASNVLPDEVANPITPKYGLSYQLTDQEMVYFTAAKGYRAGGGNSASVVGNSICNPSLATLGLSSAPATFTSDSLWSYELGTKGTFFDRRLNVEASAYLIHWSDIQTSVALPSCGQSFTTNRGKAVSQGFDLQVAALPVPGVKLALAVGYTDAYYPNASYGAPVDGVTPLLNAAGDKLVNVLPWTASAIAEYSHDIGFLWNDARSYLRLDYRWLDAGNTYNPEVAGYDPAMSPYQNPAYSMLNVRLGVLHKGLDVSAFINNSTHSNPALAYAHDLPGEALFYASSIRPFTAGLSAYYRW